MRVAVYYAPSLDDPLWVAGCRWLGRDPESGAELAQPPVRDLAASTRAAGVYGFHATLKPPMRLAGPYGGFMDDVRRVAAAAAPFALPRLAVAELSGFLALRETAACPALQDLADRCVADLDRHREPPDAAELARRRGAGLPPAQDRMLERWGYPHVLETWFFHMTLTRRLQGDELGRLRAAAEAWFAPALTAPRTVESVCVFTQRVAGAPFLLAERVRLGSR